MQLQLPESTVGNTQGVSTSSSASSSPSTTSIGSPSTQSSNTSAIIGGTVGGVLGLGLIVALIIYLVKLDDNKKHRRQAPSAAFAKAAPTPDGAAAAGFRSASRQANPLAAQPFTSGSSVGHGGSNHGHRGASPVFQLGYTNGTPWSPPPPSSTPTGTVSPMSAQSLLSAQNYGGGGRFGSNSFDYPNSSNGHGTVDLLGHSGSLSSMRCVRLFPCGPGGYGRVLTARYQVDDSHDAVCRHSWAAIGDICAGSVRKYKADTSLRCSIWAWTKWLTPIAVFGVTRDMTPTHARGLVSIHYQAYLCTVVIFC